ncbi:hypothetical protein CC86DRAFT_390339 [Ophiobolus disseminans]|uniref:Uncharacterized protein n=1 Tax=Ophiobolus disseminans TaxID=1469910 RepID=A0A6A7AFY7_9PLEO|nr:hypothetical protein CC86DRAFT_390339 [Ophiobolus disseminans]
MASTAVAASGTTTALFALGKASWRIGVALSDLNEYVDIVGSQVKDLTGEVKVLGIECDLLYARLEELVDDGLCSCLATQVDESSRTLHELELFVRIVRGEETRFIGQAQRLRKLDKSRDKVAETSLRVVRHTNAFRLTLLLIDLTTTYLAPVRIDQQLPNELERSQTLANKLQQSSAQDPNSRLSHTEVILIRHAQVVIGKATDMYDASWAAESAKMLHSSTEYRRLAAWVYTLNTIRQDQRYLDHLDSNSRTTDMSRSAMDKHQHTDTREDECDNDLGADIVESALDTGTEAFQSRAWKEAESLFHEALRILQQLPKHQLKLFDLYSLHYKLAVVAYHTHESADAEEALKSFIQQSTSSDEQRGCNCNATHLLSQLYIRTGYIDRAKVECEKALQARRRLLGKQSEASLESLALMGHIYVLMDNRALAKSCIAMIPEGRREAILTTVETSLGAAVEHLDFSSLLTPPLLKDSPRPRHQEAQSLRNEACASPVGLGLKTHVYGSSSTTAYSPATSPWQSTRSVTMASLSLSDSRQRSPTIASSEACSPVNENANDRSLSRKDILNKVGCQPRDRIEEAVCKGDLPTLINLLGKKKGFWRSGMRKRVRPERVTALHFAALFGETDMAQRLVNSNFNVNEIPFGYSTSLTPLHFAIGARQVDMVEFLVANGARPTEPDTWSSLAGQLMSRSWLVKTMSESEKEFVSHRMILILNILIKQGWDVNAPIETSGKTVLHQAVSFWTGSYQWDLNLRDTVTTFLCERGADAFRANKEGRTPYDLASTSGHQNLLSILEHGARRKELDASVAHLVELPS